MKILALEHELPGATPEKFREHAGAEARQVWELYRAGVIRELYFRADWNEAVLILEHTSLTKAQAALETLPFVRAGLIRFELVPLKPYSGFERLFAAG